MQEPPEDPRTAAPSAAPSTAPPAAPPAEPPAEPDPVIDACQRVADALAAPGRDVAVLLHSGGTLHCHASSGTSGVCYILPPDAGALGIALGSGQVAVDDPVDGAGPYPVTPHAALVLAVPVPGDGHPIGVLKLDLAERGDLAAATRAARAAAGRLGARLTRLGHSVLQTPAQQLIHHALRIVSASDERALVTENLCAAREVSGLATAVGIRQPPDGPPLLITEPGHPTPLADRMSELAPEQLTDIATMTHRYGSWFTAAAPGRSLAPALAPAPLRSIGARTVVAVPIGRHPGVRTSYRRTLLVLDEAVRRPRPDTIGLLELLGAQAAVSLERLWLLQSLKDRVGRDPLTGLGHQDALRERLGRAVPGRTAVLLIDVDHFKEINDTHGHATGDRVLMRLAAALRGALRPTDELYRVGGDEFVAVLTVENISAARAVGERLLAAAHRAGCTVSIGVCPHSAGQPVEHTLRRADSAMYAAKRDGRDQMRVAPAGTAGA